MYLNRLSEIASKDVVKNTNTNKLNTKILNLGNKILGVSTVIQKSQYNTDKQILETKWRYDKKYPTLVL